MCFNLFINYATPVTMTYSEKLKLPKWQKKRLEILDLKGFKCEVCGDEENQIQVHHRFYLKGREPWQYDNDMFMCLCDSCHERIHSVGAKNQSYLIPIGASADFVEMQYLRLSLLTDSNNRALSILLKMNLIEQPQ